MQQFATCRSPTVAREAQTAKAKLAGHDVLLAKPETFMNLSGLSVAALLKEMELGVEDLIVLYDELAIPLGTVRIRERGSAGGHNGVKSISGEAWDGRMDARSHRDRQSSRLRVDALVKSGGTDYLLSPMRKQSLAELDEGLQPGGTRGSRLC